MMKDNTFKQLTSSPKGIKKSISKRFRNINLFLFFLIIVIISLAMYMMLQTIAEKVSKDYARLYADNAVGIFNTHLKGEIALIAKTAKSDHLIQWFMDEDDHNKKLKAYNEMMETINISSGQNLYIGIDRTLREYSVQEDSVFDEVKYHATLSEENSKDDWYFECMSNPKEYMLNIDIDKKYHRKSVWLNYKVSYEGIDYGVLATALEFSDIFEQLFSQYESKGVRSLIIDEYGYIQMDSALLGDENFLHTLEMPHIRDELEDELWLRSIEVYTKQMQHYDSSLSDTTVLELSSKDYQYATIAPIPSTTWTVVTLYNSSALFSLTNLMPLLSIILIVFTLFILVINRTLAVLLLRPFNKLVKSIEQVKGNLHEQIYGLGRDDEIGELANTITNMKQNLINALSMVHYDALTGIYNRRYFDESLNKIINTLCSSNSEMSVLLIDIDYFKNYNDTYGHNAGDECLRKVASILSQCITKTDDFVVRYGGEEFVIILPNTDTQSACNIAKKLLSAFEEAQLPHLSSHVANYLTVSIGLTTVVINDKDRPEDYIKQADEALYLSKQNGRNRYTIYTE